MQELFDKAKAEGKWLWTRYHDLWFSPQELMDAQFEGRFLWGPENWELRDPQEELLRLEGRIKQANEQFEAFRDRIDKAKQQVAQ